MGAGGTLTSGTLLLRSLAADFFQSEPEHLTAGRYMQETAGDCVNSPGKPDDCLRMGARSQAIITHSSLTSTQSLQMAWF